MESVNAKEREPRIHSTLPNADVWYLSLPTLFMVLVTSLYSWRILSWCYEWTIYLGVFHRLYWQKCAWPFGMDDCAELCTAWLGQWYWKVWFFRIQCMKFDSLTASMCVMGLLLWVWFLYESLHKGSWNFGCRCSTLIFEDPKGCLGQLWIWLLGTLWVAYPYQASYHSTILKQQERNWIGC